MIISEFENIKISAISAAVSNDWSSLLDFSDEDPTVIKKFIKKTGVEGRYNAGIKQTTSDFCYAAAKKSLKKSILTKKDWNIGFCDTNTGLWYSCYCLCIAG